MVVMHLRLIVNIYIDYIYVGKKQTKTLALHDGHMNEGKLYIWPLLDCTFWMLMFSCVQLLRGIA